MARVSLIVTVYNLEAYIEETLRSLMAQTYRDIEIICVDDGSTDGGAAILARLANEDARIHVFTQKNSGAGAARNTGLACANGEYVMILDGDDVYDPALVEHLLAAAALRQESVSSGEDAQAFAAASSAERADAVDIPVDVVVCRSEEFDDATGAVSSLAYSIRMDQIPAHNPFSPDEMCDYLFSAFVGWPWDKLYRRQFLLDEGLRFPSLHNSEDLEFVFLAIALAGRISVCDEVLIRHRAHRAASVSGSRLSHPDDFYQAICALKARLQLHPRYAELSWGFLNWAMDYTLWNIITLPESPQRTELIRRLVTGEFSALELDIHGREYYSLYTSTAMQFDLLEAEYLGEDAPRARVDDARPKLGLPAEMLRTAHHQGWGAARWQIHAWKARRNVSGNSEQAVKASQRGRSHWHLLDK